MQDYHFNFEISTLLKHFAAAFNGVQIKRYNGSRYAKETIKVPLTYAPKSHIIADIVGTTDTVRLPIMAVEIKSQGRANDRVKNKIDDIVYKNTDGTYVSLKAIPWDISLEMTILAKYQEDMDQIVQNFAVHTNPYIVVSWQEPKSGRELRTEILWDGTMSYTYPGKDQGPKDPPFRITASTSFTIKGYLFKTQIENPKPICFIETDYIITDKFYCNYETLATYVSENETETYATTGRPVLRYVTPYYLQEGLTPNIKLQGFSLNDVNAIFISGSDPTMYPHVAYQPFSALNAFSAYPVGEFRKAENTLTFTLPAPSSDGFIDIIAVNSCGYGKLTEDANRCGRMENPYPIDSPEHYSWTVLQFPYLNGLIVSDYFDPLCIDDNDQVYEYSESEIDREALITKIKELMVLGSVSAYELTGG